MSLAGGGRTAGAGHPKKDGHDLADLERESLEAESLDLPVTILQSSSEFMELSEAI